jgi:hypothetical protein
MPRWSLAVSWTHNASAVALLMLLAVSTPAAAVMLETRSTKSTWSGSQCGPTYVSVGSSRRLSMCSDMSGDTSQSVVGSVLQSCQGGAWTGQAYARADTTCSGAGTPATSFLGCQTNLGIALSNDYFCGMVDEDAHLATPLTVPPEYPSGPSDWASSWVGTYALTSESACTTYGSVDGVQRYDAIAAKRPCCGEIVQVERMHNTALKWTLRCWVDKPMYTSTSARVFSLTSATTAASVMELAFANRITPTVFTKMSPGTLVYPSSHGSGVLALISPGGGGGGSGTDPGSGGGGSAGAGGTGGGTSGGTGGTPTGGGGGAGGGATPGADDDDDAGGGGGSADRVDPGAIVGGSVAASAVVCGGVAVAVWFVKKRGGLPPPRSGAAGVTSPSAAKGAGHAAGSSAAAPMVNNPLYRASA